MEDFTYPLDRPVILSDTILTWRTFPTLLKNSRSSVSRRRTASCCTNTVLRSRSPSVSSGEGDRARLRMAPLGGSSLLAVSTRQRERDLERLLLLEYGSEVLSFEAEGLSRE